MSDSITPSHTADDENALPPEPQRQAGWGKAIREVAIIIGIALVFSVCLKLFLVRAFYIPSTSMVPTLQVNDRILVNELAPDVMELHRGDVVVFKDPGGWLPGDSNAHEPWTLQRGVDDVLTAIGLSAGDSEEYLVKRVIGLPGDHVTCKSPTSPLTVNGKAVDDKAFIANGATPCTETQLFDVTVPKDSYWVMGDNRQNSADSSAHTDLPGDGSVPKADITGRAFFITWPFERFGSIDTHRNVFASIPTPSAHE